MIVITFANYFNSYEADILKNIIFLSHKTIKFKCDDELNIIKGLYTQDPEYSRSEVEKIKDDCIYEVHWMRQEENYYYNSLNQ